MFQASSNSSKRFQLSKYKGTSNFEKVFEQFFFFFFFGRLLNSLTLFSEFLLNVLMFDLRLNAQNEGLSLVIEF